MPKEQARAIVARIIHHTSEGFRHSGQTPALSSQQDRPQGSRGRGGRGRRGGGGDGERRRRGRGEGEGITQHPPSPPTRRASSRQREGQPAREGRVEAEQDPEGQKRARKRTERPHGGDRLRSLAWGGTPPPQRKMRTSRDSPQNVRTCCCRESIETSRITTTGRTWTGGLQTTLHGSVAGAGSLRNQRAGTPRPP